jgi:dTDP-4-dehydrorhamnose 3,5-epimerase
MAEENPDTARSLAERIRQLSRHHQENLGSNPRYWRRSFSRANRRIAVKEATLRRLLYNSGEPKVRPKTRRKLLRVIKALELMIQNQGEEKPDSDKEQRVNNRTIDGVEIKELKLIPDSRGFLMEFLRNDDELFYNAELPFGQAYVTTCYPGVIKGWHAHRHQYDRFGCIYGMAKLVLYDDRPDSPTHGMLNEFVVGHLRPRLIVIPPGVQHGFTAVGDQTAVMLNIPTREYNYDEPDEQRLDPHDSYIPYNWKQIDR